MQLDPSPDDLHQADPRIGLGKALGAEQARLGQSGLEFLDRDALGYRPDLGHELFVAMGPRFGAGTGAIGAAAFSGFWQEEQVHGDIALAGQDDGRLGLYFPEPALGQFDALGVQEVDLVENNEVGAGDLVGKCALQISAFRELFGVGHHHRHVVPDPATDGLAPEIQLGVERQRDPRGLDHHSVWPDFLAQSLERDQEIIREFAAHAAAFDLHVGVAAAPQQGAIDPQSPEFVGDQGHANAGADGLVQQPPDQGGLARAQEA